jgi:hypothetical protein
MLTILVLVCSFAATLDPGSLDQNNVVDVTHVPEEIRDWVTCIMYRHTSDPETEFNRLLCDYEDIKGVLAPRGTLRRAGFVEMRRGVKPVGVAPSVSMNERLVHFDGDGDLGNTSICSRHSQSLGDRQFRT